MELRVIGDHVIHQSSKLGKHISNISNSLDVGSQWDVIKHVEEYGECQIP
jgi:hypothetical protein